MNKLYITFDVEDFINPRSIKALKTILEMLKKHDLKALFFITGHMAERISDSPDIVEMLRAHQIGYHSSSHSVRPTILEFTDVENYSDAYQTSMERENSHINPLTGEIEGKGGIQFIRNLFVEKEIVAYRAPGCCWSPPHLESLRDLGIQYNFSSHISPKPVYYKGVTFYPYQVLGDWSGSRLDYFTVLTSIFRREYTVIGVHPNTLVNQNMWDCIFYDRNPEQLFPVKSRNPQQVYSLFDSFESLLKQLSFLHTLKLIEVTPRLTKASRKLNVEKIDFEEVYERSVLWAKRYVKYHPKFLRSHFLKFFTVSPRMNNQLTQRKQNT